MVRFLAIVVVLVTGTVWSESAAAVVSATLATNEVHLPEDPSLQRQPHSKASTTPVTYEVEHAQSELAARMYVASLSETDISRVESWCLSVPCDASSLHYCRSSLFINDHCCCEQHHTKEQLPWIPHTCLLRPGERCTANAGSCSNYRTIKVCCCDGLTKLEYKRKFSSAVRNGAFHFMKLMLLIGVLIAVGQYCIL